ncbi:MAG TPA: hypothetical protein VL093_00440 [Flavipsychrobacter sp.]|nr:hypothetical protein [Flavipsychrobacter sp.]
MKTLTNFFRIRTKHLPPEVAADACYSLRNHRNEENIAPDVRAEGTREAKTYSRPSDHHNLRSVVFS